MERVIVCQGREFSDYDLELLKVWVKDRAHLSRHGMAKQLCRLWGWQNDKGRLKTFAARSLLIKLEQRGIVELPPLQTNKIRDSWKKSKDTLANAPDSTPINSPLAQLMPIKISMLAPATDDDQLFNHYLCRHHYLGFNRTVGENIKYLVRDRQGRDLACVLFGAAAWKTSDRDKFIGWSRKEREANLKLLTNNTRFLILPWVTVKNLASHILGLAMRRINEDWLAKYSHPLTAIETFVERDRFQGTCYKAANWKLVGQTKGRSRQDRYNNLVVPVKDIYLYPLIKNFQEALCSVDH